MKSSDDLRNILKRIDGKGYKSYRDIEGEYAFDGFVLYIDRAQGDPFASPSRVRVRVSMDAAGFPADSYSGSSRETALRDFIARAFCDAAGKSSKGNRGSGKSGVISMRRPGQEILERSSVVLEAEYVEARLRMGLPAFGRKVAGRHAEAMFFEELTDIVNSSMLFSSLDSSVLYRHVETCEDADALRREIEGLGCVSFVAEGSVLPRVSGVDTRPMNREEAVPFRSPESMKMDIELPNRGQITGMGIKKGVTLIVGGGYHGKSTLLRAIEHGVYNHIPGDGREFIVTNPNAVKIRAEDGRRIEKVDISPFISNLPFGKDTTAFSTEEASGSTSQAANIIEAVEAGADVLLIDEDTSATNFMMRDHRMQALVSKDSEPITPFIDRVRSLNSEKRVSTILVIGGSGDYFDVADLVIRMNEYVPVEVTEEARNVARDIPTGRETEGGSFGRVTERIPLAESLDPSKGRRDVKISARGLHTILYGRHTIDLSALEQIVDPCQTETIAEAIEYARGRMKGEKTLREVVSMVMMQIGRSGLDVIGGKIVSGDYAEFRSLELAAAINRLRTLKVEQK